MKSSKLNNEQSVKVSVEIITLNDTLCAFKAIKTTTTKSKSTVEESEGIGQTKSVKSAHRKCILPSPSHSYFKKSDEFLNLIKVYGYHDTLLEHNSFNGFKPLAPMKEIIDNSRFTFDEIKNGTLDDVMDNLIYSNHASHSYIFIKTGKLINTAIFSDRLMLEETHYKNFKDIINKMIEEKRIVVQDERRGEIFHTHYGSDLQYVNGRVQFSDDEWNELLENMKINDQHIDSHSVKEAIRKNDMLGINQYIKTEEEKQADWERENECD